MPMTGAQLRAVLVDLEAAAGSGVTIPDLPMTTAQLREVLLALEAALSSGSGVVLTSAPPTQMQGQNGDVALRVWDGNLQVYGPKTTGDWGVPVFSWDGGLPAPPPRNLLLEDVRGNEFWLLDSYPQEVTIGEIKAFTVGTPDRSVQFSLWHGADPTAPGTEVVTGGITVADASVSVTTFDAATVPADHYLWFTTSNLVGSIDMGLFGVRFV